jgi:hypothetical protein
MPRLPIVAAAVIVAIVAGWFLSAHLAAQRKLAALQPLPDRGSYSITLDFAPERFHQQRLQEAGRLVEVRERTVYMMDVTPKALHAIAGQYWIGEVARWEGK